MDHEENGNCHKRKGIGRRAATSSETGAMNNARQITNKHNNVTNATNQTAITLEPELEVLQEPVSALLSRRPPKLEGRPQKVQLKMNKS